MPRSCRYRDLCSLVFVLGALAGVTGCGGDPAGATSTIDRETFTATYLDLRLSALDTPSGEITAEERTRILDSHQVTEAQLLEFAQVYGGDPETMQEIWSEVESRLLAAAGETVAERGGDIAH